MIRTGFLSAPERSELEACVRSQREDHGIARRANAILLLDDGKSCQVIAEFLYLDDDTIRGWYKTYREGPFSQKYFTGLLYFPIIFTTTSKVKITNMAASVFSINNKKSLFSKHSVGQASATSHFMTQSMSEPFVCVG